MDDLVTHSVAGARGTDDERRPEGGCSSDAEESKEGAARGDAGADAGAAVPPDAPLHWKLLLQMEASRAMSAVSVKVAHANAGVERLRASVEEALRESILPRWLARAQTAARGSEGRDQPSAHGEAASAQQPSRSVVYVQPCAQAANVEGKSESSDDEL